MSLPEIRSHIVAAYDGVLMLVASLERYRASMPGSVRFGLRSSTDSLCSALAHLDGLDAPLLQLLGSKRSDSGSTQGQG